MKKDPVIFAIHGINTGLTNRNWNWLFQSYVVNNGIRAQVITEHYKAGPFPFWNTKVKNPKLALSAAMRLCEFSHDVPINIVSHSNGTDISIRAIQQLQQAGRKVETLVLTGAAIHSDIELSGLRDFVDKDVIGRVVSYSSIADNVVDKLEIFDGYYGSLGYRGMQLGGNTIGMVLKGYEQFDNNHALVTRRFPTFGHSGYFDDRNLEATFDTIICDLGI